MQYDLRIVELGFNDHGYNELNSSKQIWRQVFTLLHKDYDYNESRITNKYWRSRYVRYNQVWLKLYFDVAVK